MILQTSSLVSLLCLCKTLQNILRFINVFLIGSKVQQFTSAMVLIDNFSLLYSLITLLWFKFCDDVHISFTSKLLYIITGDQTAISKHKKELNDR